MVRMPMLDVDIKSGFKAGAALSAKEVQVSSGLG